MDVNPSDPQNDGIIHALFAAIMALGMFVVNMYRRKVDRMEKSHHQFVTREELENKFETMREERQRMHEENIANMRDIRADIAAGQRESGDDIRSIHQRIDEVMARGNSGSRR